MRQAIAFAETEGDRFYERNKDKAREPDPVFDTIRQIGLRPETVLEIGCGNGWRLRNIRRELGSICYGIDASRAAIQEAPLSIEKDGIRCWQGLAHNLTGVKTGSVDMVIYGFCLYLIDREDLFKVVAECDRVLKDGGYVVIHDFYSFVPMSRVYEHAPQLRSYKQDYPLLWLGSPAYVEHKAVYINNDDDGHEMVWVLHKDVANGWLLKEAQ